MQVLDFLSETLEEFMVNSTFLDFLSETLEEFMVNSTFQTEISTKNS